MNLAEIWARGDALPLVLFDVVAMLHGYACVALAHLGVSILQTTHKVEPLNKFGGFGDAGEGLLLFKLGSRPESKVD